MNSKRLRYSIIVFIITYIIFLICIYSGLEPINISTALMMLNTPLYTYILGETIRKSDKKTNN